MACMNQKELKETCSFSSFLLLLQYETDSTFHTHDVVPAQGLSATSYR